MYGYYQFDQDTFIVFNIQTNQEFCICGVFDAENIPAEQRAKKIVTLLNENNQEEVINQVSYTNNPAEMCDSNTIEDN